MTSLPSASTIDNERREKYEDEKREDRWQSDQIKGYNVKTYAKKDICLICLVLDQIFLLYLYYCLI